MPIEIYCLSNKTFMIINDELLNPLESRRAFIIHWICTTKFKVLNYQSERWQPHITLLLCKQITCMPIFSKTILTPVSNDASIVIKIYTRLQFQVHKQVMMVWMYYCSNVKLQTIKVISYSHGCHIPLFSCSSCKSKIWNWVPRICGILEFQYLLK